MTARLHALIPCAGIGARAAADGPKQYARLGDSCVVGHTLQALMQVPNLQLVMVVLSPDDVGFAKHVGARLMSRVLTASVGGSTRAHTVLAGLQALRKHGGADGDWVLVHDAARCLVDPLSVQRLIAACQNDAVGGLLALPLADTLKQASDGRATATLPRSDKWLAQTPQMFKLGMLMQALTAALADPNVTITDEASAMERLGHAPLLVPGDWRNLKITWPEDFALAEQLLGLRHASANQAPNTSNQGQAPA
jgi:2-C-methyl-D-erythritol 4-phosphate cytidylyltransferase